MSTRGGLQVEYAVSSRASCKACGGGINQDSVRVGKETKSDHHDGWDLSWYHLKCCNKHYNGPRFSKIAELKHWERLRWDDQEAIRKTTSEPLDNSQDTKDRKKHNETLWAMKDEITEHLNNKQIKSLLEANTDELPDKIQNPTVVHLVADGLAWGRIGPCPTCKSQRLYYDGTTYKCKGWLSSGFTRCDFVGKDGVYRTKYVIPEALKKIAYLKNFKYPADHSKIPFGSGGSGATATTTAAAEVKEEDDNTPEDEVPVGKELFGMTVITAGTKKDLGMTADELGDLIEEHGGEITGSVEEATLMIAPEAELTKRSKTKKVKDALASIPIFSVDLIHNLCERKEEGIELRKNEVAKKYLLEPSKLGDNPIALKYRINAPATTTTTTSSSSSGEGGEKRKRVARREPKIGSDILKIDPASGRSATAQIIVADDPELGATTYNVMLNQTDVSTGQNKFYRLQAYKAGKSYYGFINYGRIGTDTGAYKEYPYKTEKAAIQFFIEKYEEKTGNKWANRDIFEKKGGKYYMVDLDDGWGDEDEEVQQTIKRKKIDKESTSQASQSSSLSSSSGEVVAKKRLPEPVSDLIRLLFDKEMMKKQMVSLDIDIKKMPLGKISKKQILQGYSVLTEIQDLLQEATPSKAKLADCANRLYTLIPHDFGHQMPPLIENLEQVKKKMNMLDTLIDLEIAANLMKETEEEDNGEHDKLESNYKALKTGLEPIDKNSDLYKLLESYAYNTQDKTVYQPTFNVEDIFQVTRESEEPRFEPWKANHNRVLLWHGSRLTNWVGILSQGLRIAPPEAPKTGYRFGKGVYFADCVSKSTSYCFSTRDSPTAVLLLAEVALGQQNELKHDQYMEKAPAGTHSTKALGMAAPAPALDQAIHPVEGVKGAKEVKLEEAIKVPCGKIANTGLKTSCTHNEYIVYDVSQIKIKYLLRVKINHK